MLSTPRRVLIVLAFAAIVVTGIEPQLLEYPFRNRAAQALEMSRRADGQWQQYVQFLQGVRAHTRPGATILIIVPPTHWDSGYSYAYYRASYFLTGREVLPALDAQDHAHVENVAAARYVAVWQLRIAPAGEAAVWAGDGGTLWRRR